jgi:hypothetical protein
MSVRKQRPHVLDQEALVAPPIAAVSKRGGTKRKVPHDKDLLGRARVQWQFGYWESLASLAQDTLQHHPGRAELALLVAAGHQQLNNIEAVRQFVRLAQEWGCSKKLIVQILLAGVHNTLGRALALSGQEQSAFEHFKAAITTGKPDSDVLLITQARVGQQLSQLGLPGLASHESNSRDAKCSSQTVSHSCPFTIQRLASHDLGDAWAANTVNTVIFRHHGILTSGLLQFTAFYAGESTLRVVQRDLSNESIELFDLTGEFNVRDAHNSISLGCDRQGYLHLTYDHHGTNLRYRRSMSPCNIQGWTDELGMTGVHEGKVTYPCFILSPDDGPLMLLYRDGLWNKGTARIKVYDEAGQTWADRPTPILSGAEQRPWTSNAYWNHPVMGSDGSMHLSFVWRTDSIGAEQLINNINVCYARSMDNGLTWTTSYGRPYRLPITQVNAETVHPVSPGCNLINQTSMALDSRNRPHIVFYSNDPNGIPQYQHLWFDGRSWRHRYISQRKTAFSLMGGGTLQIPISRPEIVMDRQDNAYVIYRGDLSDNKMTVLQLPGPDYPFDPALIQTVWDANLGYAEPIIDRTRWQQENILTLLLQHNHQPDGDRSHDVLSMPVTLIDLRFH